MNTTELKKSEHDKSILLRILGEEFQVCQLNDYTLEINAPHLAEQWSQSIGSTHHSAVLVGSGISLPIKLRVRHVDAGRIRFAFHDASLEELATLKRLQKSIADSAKDEIHKLSYDALANGGSPNGSAKKAPMQEAPSLRKDHAHFKTLFKKLAAVSLMFATIAGIIVWLTFVVNSHATVEVLNGVIVGNYLPVNAPQQSCLLEVYVKPGEEVQKGDLLAKMSSTLVQSELALVEAKLRRARSEASALRQESERLASTLKFAQLKIERDFGVVEAEIERAQSMLGSANAQLKRLDPLMSRGNIAVAEYDAANALLATAKAELVRQHAMKESLVVAQLAAKSNVLVTPHGVSNPMSELDTKIALSEAVILELEETQVALHKASSPVEIFAPEPGIVYAVYRNAGETVKVADQLMAINVNGSNWAMGTVAIDLAPRIRPGQPVSVSIPALGISTDGTVVGVGSRSLYGLGGFHSEMRSVPTEVPIRIALDIEEERIPSGLRLSMSVRVKEPLKDFKNWIQEKALRLFNSTPYENKSQDLHSPNAKQVVEQQDSRSTLGS